jgi:hypothetical protein
MGHAVLYFRKRRTFWYVLHTLRLSREDICFSAPFANCVPDLLGYSAVGYLLPSFATIAWGFYIQGTLSGCTVFGSLLIACMSLSTSHVFQCVPRRQSSWVLRLHCDSAPHRMDNNLPGVHWSARTGTSRPSLSPLSNMYQCTNTVNLSSYLTVTAFSFTCYSLRACELFVALYHIKRGMLDWLAKPMSFLGRLIRRRKWTTSFGRSRSRGTPAWRSFRNDR